MRRLRKGDQVKIISGNERGKEGEVLQVITEKDRVLVRGVNFVKRHQRPSARQREGGIIEREGSIHISNVMLVDPDTGEPTRVGIRREDGMRIRVAKTSGQDID